MKKFFALMLLSLSFSAAVKAQPLPGINIYYVGDTLGWNQCVIPQVLDFYLYGSAGGYPLGDSVLVEVSFGDGTDTSFYQPIIQQSYFFNDSITHAYTLPGVYSAQFIVTGSDGAADTSIFDNILVAATCGDASGKVYVDANSNCVFDIGETVVENAWITASYNGSVIAGDLTDANGDYVLSLPSGFTLEIAPYNPNYTVACPASGQYTISSLPANNSDFALQCNAQYDLTPYVGGQGFRVNNTTTFYLSALNQFISCTPPTGTVTLTMDPMLTYVSSAVTPVSVNGSTVVFNAGQLNNLSPAWSTQIVFQTSPLAAIGDTLCLTVAVDPSAGDANPSDNTLVACYPVRNSCDPNEKYELHAGAGTGSILPGTRLDYTVMFQNVGNDVAYEVSIVDTLDANLDLSTLEITGFSHPADVKLINGNVLKFEFDNINLAAASVNEPASHGYVSFRVNHVPGLANGTSISNRAHIFFDFNGAIITNTVTDVIDITLGVPQAAASPIATIAPNPANDHFMISTAGNDNVLVTVCDIAGRTVASQWMQQNDRMDISELPSGNYTVSFESGGHKSVQKLVVY